MNTLETSGGIKVTDPTPEQLDQALAEARPDHWFLHVDRGEDDYMEAMVEDDALWVEIEENGVFRRAASYVDDAALKEMLASFLDNDGRWRDRARWVEPGAVAAKPRKVPMPVIAAAIGLALLVPIFITRKGEWFVVWLALSFPYAIAVASLAKMAEVKRASTWTRTSARIVRSELVAETRQGKEVQVPRVEYEFTLGFHPVRGRRYTLGDMGPNGAEAVLRRYPVGAGVTAYYNPQDPDESVIERDLPAGFHLVWAFVGIVGATILAVAWWFLVR